MKVFISADTEGVTGVTVAEAPQRSGSILMWSWKVSGQEQRRP